MKIQDINGNERNETRTEILARHAEMTARHNEGFNLLAEIHAEEPYFQIIAEENRIPLADEAQDKSEKGLTTEINRSTALVNVADTLQNVTTLLRRHPYGYRNGSRDSKGRVIAEPFTAAENEAAEKRLASLKQ